MSPDGHYVAAGSLDKTVRVWDTTSGRLMERLESPDGHKDSVYSVAFAPNGRDLVSGSLDKTIKLWELSAPRAPQPAGSVRGGKCVRTFEGHKVRLYPEIPVACCTLLTAQLSGLRSQCLPYTRRPLGYEWLEGQRCSILGSDYWKCADDASRPQELRSVFLNLLYLWSLRRRVFLTFDASDLGRPKPYEQLVRYWQWRYARKNLEVSICTLVPISTVALFADQNIFVSSDTLHILDGDEIDYRNFWRKMWLVCVFTVANRVEFGLSRCV